MSVLLHQSNFAYVFRLFYCYMLIYVHSKVVRRCQVRVSRLCVSCLKKKSLPVNESKMTTIHGTDFGFQSFRKENEREPISRTSKVHTFDWRSEQTNISVNQPASLISQLFLRLHVHTDTHTGSFGCDFSFVF